ncbi:MAG TPA: HAMP domain-containing sensor histidine kinase [Acidimicrobiia bacterium]|jgi:signal transduction histidine kinase
MRSDHRRFGSVRIRLTLITTLAFALALGVAAAVLVRTVRNSTKASIRSANVTFLAQLGTSVGSGALPQELPKPPPGTRYEVYSIGTGKLVASSGGPTPSGAPFATNGVGGNVADGNVTGGNIAGGNATHSGSPGVKVTAPDEGKDSVVVTGTASSPNGPVRLVATSPLTEVRHSIDALARALYVAIPLLILLVGAVAWFLVGRALKPVDAIRSQVEDISHTTLDRRVPVPAGRDEVAALARTMNDMLDRLEESSLRQREFVSDASHELRSPIASIRAAVEVALAHPGRTDWPSVGTQVLSEGGRLEHIVTELLELARTEEQLDGPAPSVVELDEIAVEEIDRVRATTAVVVDGREVSGAQVNGSRPQLGRVVRNLLDNASAYAQSRVEIRLHDDGEHVVLTVDDDGPGIPDRDRARVFERFVRLDDARHRGGIGLGLAMVHAIVTRHGGTVDAGASPLGGARLTVRLPTAVVMADALR